MATNEELKNLANKSKDLEHKISNAIINFGNAYNVSRCIRLYYYSIKLKLRQKCILLILQDRGVL